MKNRDILFIKINVRNPRMAMPFEGFFCASAAPSYTFTSVPKFPGTKGF